MILEKSGHRDVVLNSQDIYLSQNVQLCDSSVLLGAVAKPPEVKRALPVFLHVLYPFMNTILQIILQCFRNGVF